MDKMRIFIEVDNIWRQYTDSSENISNLISLWNELPSEREKKYFINRVFKRLKAFPKQTYSPEYLSKELEGQEFATIISIASQRKSKPIINF
jgi:uncharacterized protein YozE (UPF0346 family)